MYTLLARTTLSLLFIQGMLRVCKVRDSFGSLQSCADRGDTIGLLLFVQGTYDSVLSCGGFLGRVCANGFNCAAKIFLCEGFCHLQNAGLARGSATRW